jgi:hypothetical protein
MEILLNKKMVCHLKKAYHFYISKKELKQNPPFKMEDHHPEHYHHCQIQALLP